jgi:hypothetical protein
MKGCHWYFPLKQYFFFFCATEYFVAKICLTAGVKACSCGFWLCVCACARTCTVGGDSLLMYTQHFLNIPRVSCRSTVATNVNSLVPKAL